MYHYISTNLKGYKFYYVNSILHREDGPAVEFCSGRK